MPTARLVGQWAFKWRLLRLQRLVQKLIDQARDFIGLLIKGEVPRFQHMNLSLWQIPAIRLGLGDIE
jgi:hypothetical protein